MRAQHQARRRTAIWVNVVAVVVWVVFLAAILALAFGINLLITGGDLQCVFSTDPALCAAVKGTSR